MENPTTHNGEPNRLINASSPYLQQHAYNPVDWYPWGQEALEKDKGLSWLNESKNADKLPKKLK